MARITYNPAGGRYCWIGSLQTIFGKRNGCSSKSDNFPTLKSAKQCIARYYNKQLQGKLKPVWTLEIEWVNM
jgi:hypothetical protein